MSEHQQIIQIPAQAPAAAELSPVKELPEEELYTAGLSRLPIQKKLSVGAPDDPLEQEADEMANRVMRMPQTSFTQLKPADAEEDRVQRKSSETFLQKKCSSCEEEKISRKTTEDFIQKKCAQCEEEEKETIHPKPVNTFIQKKGSGSDTAVPDNINSGIESTRGGGQQLDTATRSFMESGFGADFSSVNIHTGSYATALSSQLNAQAFTVGHDIYFNQGKYDPGSSAGRHLLAHELTHTVQQGSSPSVNTKLIQRNPEEDVSVLSERPPIHLPNPYIPEDEEERAYQEFRQQRDSYQERLRNVVLAPVERTRGDSITFLNRLRHLDRQQASLLLVDEVFFTRARRIFRGKSLWTVFTILYFNNHLIEPYLRLNYALMNSDARLLADMLSIVIQQNTSDRYYAMLREVSLTIFSSDPLLPEILRLIDHRGDEGISQHYTSNYQEVHYERNASGNNVLTYFSGPIAGDAYFSGNELRVLVRIRFVNGDDTVNCAGTDLSGCRPFYLLGEYTGKYNSWQNAITTTWNNRFRIINGTSTFNVTFVPLFMTENDGNALTVRIITDNSRSCSTLLGPGRSQQTCWFINNLGDDAVAHEFGHMIGASDEYRLPGSNQEVIDAGFNLPAEDLALTTYEGTMGAARPVNTNGYSLGNSIMNDNSNPQPRHLTRLVALINSGIARRMPPFRITGR